MLKLDALNTFCGAVSKEKSLIQDVNPYGFALTSDRGLVDTKGCFIDDLSRSIHSYLSPEFCNALIGGISNVGNTERPLPGSIVTLAGRTAMPCVCEAPPNTISSENGTKMVVEVCRTRESFGPWVKFCLILFAWLSLRVTLKGITWQSLYLVFFGTHLVLAEPAVGRYDHKLNTCAVFGWTHRLTQRFRLRIYVSSGSGRVVTSCPLSRITVARDPNPPADPSSPARRLLMAYKWFDTKAPGLFVYDEKPKVEEHGPFNKLKLWRSKLDVWFEDEGAATHAYHSIHFQIDQAKTLRGDSILDFLNDEN